MTTSFYWFDPKSSMFYGPSQHSHLKILKTDKDLIKLMEAMKPVDLEDWLFEGDLIDLDWVRLYFNHDNNELGVACRKNKNALKTIRNFIKKESFEIESLFLDINDIHIQTGLTGDDMNLYINRGRFKVVQKL